MEKDVVFVRVFGVVPRIEMSGTGVGGLEIEGRHSVVGKGDDTSGAGEE